MIILLCTIKINYIQSRDQMKPQQATKAHSSYPLPKERSHYEQIIEKLTKENAKLKRQLESLVDYKKAAQDIHRAQTKEDENVSELWRSQHDLNDNNKQVSIHFELPSSPCNEELIRENKYLRNALDMKSTQYSQQIFQRKEFLNSLELKRPCIQSHSVAQQISQPWAIQLIDFIQSAIKGFQSDRSAFIKKIEELLLLISAYEQKQKENLSKQRRLDFQLSVAKEQLAIFKRLQKTK